MIDLTMRTVSSEVNDDDSIFNILFWSVENQKATSKQMEKQIVKSYYITLSEEEQKIIFNIIKMSFADCPYFESMVEDKLVQLLADTNNAEISINTTKRVTDKYFDTKSFKDTPARKLVFTQIQLIFKCCFVMILKIHPALQELKWKSVEELIENYPSFAEVSDPLELQYLLEFRNTLRIALEIVPSAAHKQLLINIAGRLEGSNCVEYITGGGQKPCVKRRVLIYEQEGNVQPAKKNPKKSPELLQGVKKYQGHEYVSVRKVKAVKLSEEEIQQLKRPRNSSVSDTDSIDHAIIPRIKTEHDKDQSDYLHQRERYDSVENGGEESKPVHLNAHSINLGGHAEAIGILDQLVISRVPVMRLTTFGQVNVVELCNQQIEPNLFDNVEQLGSEQEKAAANTLLHFARDANTYTDCMLKEPEDL